MKPRCFYGTHTMDSAIPKKVLSVLRFSCANLSGIKFALIGKSVVPRDFFGLRPCALLCHAHHSSCISLENLPTPQICLIANVKNHSQSVRQIAVSQSIFLGLDECALLCHASFACAAPRFSSHSQDLLMWIFEMSNPHF